MAYPELKPFQKEISPSLGDLSADDIDETSNTDTEGLVVVTAESKPASTSQCKENAQPVSKAVFVDSYICKIGGNATRKALIQGGYSLDTIYKALMKHQKAQTKSIHVFAESLSMAKTGNATDQLFERYAADLPTLAAKYPVNRIVNVLRQWEELEVEQPNRLPKITVSVVRRALRRIEQESQAE